MMKSFIYVKTGVCATVREVGGHFPVGLRLPPSFKNDSDDPGILALIRPCPLK